MYRMYFYRFERPRNLLKRFGYDTHKEVDGLL